MSASTPEGRTKKKLADMTEEAQGLVLLTPPTMGWVDQVSQM